MPTFQEFAAASPDKDLKTQLEGYRGQVHLDLLRNGEYDEQLVADIDNQLAQHAADNGVEIQSFGAAQGDDDAGLVARHALDTGDTEARDAAGRLRALKDPSIKDSYADRPDEYAAKLEEAQIGFDAAAPLEKREAARRAALSRGDIPFATFTDKDGNRRVELGANAIKDLAGDDAALAEVFAANPSLDRSVIPEVRRKLQTPNGFTSTLAGIERQQDAFAGIDSMVKENPKAFYQLDSLRQAIGDGTMDNLDPQLDQLDDAMSGSPLHEQFTPEERKAFLKDYITRQSTPKLNPDAPEEGLRTLSTGEVHVPTPLMMNKAIFDKVLPKLPEGQREMAAAQREQVVAAYAKDAFKTITARRPEFADEYADQKAAGKSDTEILDAWTADPKNQSTAYEYVSGITESIFDATIGTAAAATALATGSETAMSIVKYFDKDNRQRKEFANIVGKELDWKYDIATMAAPVVVDIFTTKGAATAVRATVGAAARAAVKPVVRGFFGATVRQETKGLVGRFVKGAVTRQLEREGLSALPGAAASLRPTEVLGAIGRDIEAGLARAEYSTAMFATGFNRSAGASYVQTYSTLEGLKNPDGSRKFNDEQVRDMAVKHATTVGTMTGLTTLGFNVMGLAGTEKIFSGGLTRKQLGGVFTRLSKDWGNIAPAVREGIDMTDPDRMLASMMTKSIQPLWKVGIEGAKGEFPEEFTQQFLEDIATSYTTGEKFDIDKTLRGALYAGMLGGVMGAGATVTADVVSSPEVDARREAAVRRNALLTTAAKLDANPNLKATADAVRQLALDGIPQAGPTPTKEDIPEGVPADGDESAPGELGVAGESAPEDVEYFNFVMGEPAAPSDPAAAPVVKSKEELDAELQGIVQRFKARKGPPIVLDPIPLEHPDRIYLDKLPLKHPDRILLDPIDVAEVATYGRGLSDEGGRILLERVQLTRQAGPVKSAAPAAPTEDQLLQQRHEARKQLIGELMEARASKWTKSGIAPGTDPAIREQIEQLRTEVETYEAAETPEAVAPVGEEEDISSDISSAEVAVRNPAKATQQTPAEYAQWSKDNGREGMKPAQIKKLHKAEIEDVIREELDTARDNAAADLGFVGPQYPLSAEAVDAYGIKLPEGYAREGDLYVYRPTEVPAPEQQSAPTTPQAPVASNNAPKASVVAPDGSVKGVPADKLTTPLMKSWVDLNNDAPEGAIVMVRLGDFYEVFGEDAKVAAKLMNVALTKRGGTPMAGIPYHAKDTYLKKLTDAGRTVALAEMQGPVSRNGDGKRGIAEVRTPDATAPPQAAAEVARDPAAHRRHQTPSEFKRAFSYEQALLRAERDDQSGKKATALKKEGKAKYEARVNPMLEGDHREEINQGFAQNEAVSTEAVDTYGIKLPEGYAKQGDLYVHASTTPTTPQASVASNNAPKVGDPITFTSSVPGTQTPTQGVIAAIDAKGRITAQVGKTKYPNATLVTRTTEAGPESDGDTWDAAATLAGTEYDNLFKTELAKANAGDEAAAQLVWKMRNDPAHSRAAYQRKRADETGQTEITNIEAVLAAADIDPTPAERIVTDALTDSDVPEAALAETPGGKEALAEVINEAAPEIITDGMPLGTMVGLGVVSENVKTLVAAEGGAAPVAVAPADTDPDLPPLGSFRGFYKGGPDTGEGVNPAYRDTTTQSIAATREQLKQMGIAPSTRKKQYTPENSPVTQELAKHGDLADIKAWLTSVAKTGKPEHRELAKILLKFPDVLVTPVHLQDAPFAGTYVPQTGQILINTARPGPRGGVDTVLHELIHAATHAAIKNPTPEQALVLKRIDGIRKNIQRKAAKAGRTDLAYALGSNDEFFTHLLTSPAFQREVAAMTPKGERNWVQVLIDAVRDLLGMGKVPQGVLKDMIEFTQSAADLKYGRHAMTTDGKVLMLPAHHGTPHKVDKFSTDKIGTGEGAQAYGWGLYFAGDQSVAKGYAETLAKAQGPPPSGLVSIDGVTLADMLKDAPPLVRAKVTSTLKAADGDVKKALSLHDEFFTKSAKTATPSGMDILREIRGVLEGFINSKVSFSEAPTGNLYTVEILPDEDQFLDWDKPLSEQSKTIQDALLPYAESVTQTASHVYKTAESVDAGSAYRTMSSRLGAKEASKLLNELGIPGIKYLDGNSRNAGEGNHNYVIFDDSQIRITHENGVPVTPEQATAPAPGPYGTSRMDALMQMPEDVRDTVRFAELTESLGATPTQADIDSFKAENAAAYAELKAMRERVLRGAGFTVEAYHATNGDAFEIFDIAMAAPTSRYGPGFYFSSASGDTTYGSREMEVMLKMQNPIRDGDFSDYDLESEPDDMGAGYELADKITSLGFDSVDGYEESVVFDPNQIKSTEPLSIDPTTQKLIPPSQWGDAESPSILFQPSEDAWSTPQQRVSSASTSISYPDPAAKSPVIFTAFKQGKLALGPVNADIGGGRFDQITEWLKTQGVENVVWDRFNRSEEFNAASQARLQGGQANTATISNVLNVIPDEASRKAVIATAFDSLKDGGTAYFSTYTAPKAGDVAGRDAFQLGTPTRSYIPEIESVFGQGSVSRKGDILVAEKSPLGTPLFQPAEGAVSVTLTREVADRIATNLIEAGVRTQGTIAIAAEKFGVPEVAVRSVKKYLLDHYANKPTEESIEQQASMILKGWDDEKVGVGKEFRGVLPTKIAEGEALYKRMTAREALEESPSLVSIQSEIDSLPSFPSYVKGYADEEGIHVTGVYTHPNHRGKGSASEVLDQLLKISDRHGLPVDLSVDPSGNLSRRDLIGWYRSVGFKDRNSTAGDDMVYIPAKANPFSVPLFQPIELLAASHDSGIAALDNPTEAETAQLREVHELTTTGNMAGAQRARYRVDETALDRLVTYLRAAVKALSTSLKASFNMASAVHLDRLGRELAAAEDGYRVRSGVKAFDPDAPLFQFAGENADTARHAALEAKYNAGTITPEETAEAERIVEERARKEGFDTPAWHGFKSGMQGDSFDPERFYTGEMTGWFGDNRFYLANTERSARSYAGQKGETKKFFIPSPTLVGLSSTHDNILEHQKGAGVIAGYHHYVDDRGEMTEEDIKTVRGGGITKAIAEKYGGLEEYSVPNPSQIKSADPFTGVPLDQRFDDSNPSILFQLSSDSDTAEFTETNYTEVNVGNRLYESTEQDLEKKNWFVRMFAQRSDLLRAQSAIKVDREAMVNTTNYRLGVQTGVYNRAIKAESPNMDDVRSMAGSTAPVLTPEEETRLDAEYQVRLEAAEAGTDLGEIEAKATRDKTLADARRDHDSAMRSADPGERADAAAAYEQAVKDAEAEFRRASQAAKEAAEIEDPGVTAAKATAETKRENARKQRDLSQEQAKQDYDDEVQSPDVATRVAARGKYEAHLKEIKQGHDRSISQITKERDEAISLRSPEARKIQALNEAAEWLRVAKEQSMLDQADKLRTEQDAATERLARESPLTHAAVQSLRKTLDEFQAKYAKENKESKPGLALMIDRSNGLYLVRAYEFYRDPHRKEKILNDPMYADLKERLVDLFGKEFARDALAVLKADPANANRPDADLEAQARSNVRDLSLAKFEDYLLSRDGPAKMGQFSDGVRLEVERFLKKNNQDPLIAEMLGEIDDPLFNLTNTIESVSHLLFTHRQNVSLAKDGVASGYLVTEAQMHADPTKYRGWVPLVSKNPDAPAFSPLGGLYATAEHKLAFDAAFGTGRLQTSNTANQALATGKKLIMGAAGKSMATMILGNPASYVRNIFGNLFPAASQGINPFSAKGFKSAMATWNMVRGQGKGDQDFIEKMIALRVLGDGAKIEFMREFFTRYQENPTGAAAWVAERGEKLSPTAMEQLRKGKGAWDKLTDVLGRSSEFTETFLGPLVFLNELEVHLKAGFSQTDAEQEAARIAKKVLPGKSERSQAVTEFGKSGVATLMAPFLGFKSEMIRSVVGTWQVALEHTLSDNPVLRAHGIRRLAASSIIQGGVVTLLPMLLRTLAEVDDEEDQLFRAALPGYAKNSNFWYYRNADGSISTADMTFAIPYSITHDWATQTFLALHAAATSNPERLNDIPLIFGRMFGEELVGEQIVAGKVLDVMRNKDDTSGHTIWRKDEDTTSKMYKQAEHVLGGAYVPAIVKKADQLIKSANRPDKEDEPFWYSPLGITVATVAPFKPRGYETEKFVTRALRDVTTASKEQWTITSKLTSPQAMAPGEATRIIKERMDAHFKNSTRAYRFMQAAKGFGMTPRQIMLAAKEADMSRDRAQLTLQGLANSKPLPAETLRKIKEIDPKRYAEVIRAMRQQPTRVDLRSR